MEADDLTADGMKDGASSAGCMLLFLSTGVLQRPFCQLEIRAALAAHKSFVLVHEDDERHGKFDFAEFGEAPDDIRTIGDTYESMAYRRRRHEKVAFFGELERRIEKAGTFLSAEKTPPVLFRSISQPI